MKSLADKTEIRDRTTLGTGFGLFERITFRRRRRDGRMDDLVRDILDTGDGATILPYDASRGTIVLIRQFRGVDYLRRGGEALIETCAGKLEGADPVSRIVKETEEETGIRLTGTPRKLFEAYSSPGSFCERLTYFVAPYTAADRISEGGGLIDEGEDIEVLEMSLDAALAMVERGEIVDVKTIVLLIWAQANGLMTAG